MHSFIGSLHRFARPLVAAVDVVGPVTQLAVKQQSLWAVLSFELNAIGTLKKGITLAWGWVNAVRTYRLFFTALVDTVVVHIHSGKRDIRIDRFLVGNPVKCVS